MDKKDYDIGDIFRQMELDLIANMKKTLTLHKSEERREGFSWEQWQSAKLRALSAYRKKNRQIADSYSNPIKNAIENELEKRYLNAQSALIKIKDRILKALGIKRAAKMKLPLDNSESQKTKTYISKVLGREPTPPKEENFFKINDKKLNALQEAVTNDLNKAQYSVLRKMDDVYRQTIFKTHVYLQSGATSLNKAIDMATKDFLAKGIDSITYSNGAKVNIASYAEMCLRTASHRATLLGEGKKRDEFDVHLVVVTAHANTCKLCLPWQGKVLIDDVFSHPSEEYIQEYAKKYRLLSEAIKEGLLHVNCRHTLTTYFEGVTQLPKVPDSKEAIKTYEAEQKQRALERQIRKQKRIIEGTCDEENLMKEQMKLKELQKRLRQHLKDNPELRRDSSREKPGPGISNKDVKNNSERLKQNSESARIKETKDKILNNEFNSKVRFEKQKDHILGTKKWLNRAKEALQQGRIPQGAFEKNTDVQQLIDKYKGTGTIEFRGKDIYPREYVDVDSNVGIAFSKVQNKYVKTNRIAIHYSSKGVHAYPVLPPKE